MERKLMVRRLLSKLRWMGTLIRPWMSFIYLLDKEIINNPCYVQSAHEICTVFANLVNSSNTEGKEHCHFVHGLSGHMHRWCSHLKTT